jgi:hypothetical protein
MFSHGYPLENLTNAIQPDSSYDLSDIKGHFTLKPSTSDPTKLSFNYMPELTNVMTTFHFESGFTCKRLEAAGPNINPLYVLAHDDFMIGYLDPKPLMDVDQYEGFWIFFAKWESDHFRWKGRFWSDSPASREKEGYSGLFIARTDLLVSELREIHFRFLKWTGMAVTYAFADPDFYLWQESKFRSFTDPVTSFPSIEEWTRPLKPQT